MAVLPRTHACRGQGNRTHEKPKAWVHRCVAMDAEVAAVFAHMSQPVIIFGFGARKGNRRNGDGVDDPQISVHLSWSTALPRIQKEWSLTSTLRPLLEKIPP